jgi:hypothetical protein
MPKHSWSFCTWCHCAMVICGHCGNNCCNGGSSDNCPDRCDSAYAFQDTEVAPVELKERELRERTEWEKMTPEQRDASNNRCWEEVFGPV